METDFSRLIAPPFHLVSLFSTHSTSTRAKKQGCCNCHNLHPDPACQSWLLPHSIGCQVCRPVCPHACRRGGAQFRDAAALHPSESNCFRFDRTWFEWRFWHPSPRQLQLFALTSLTRMAVWRFRGRFHLHASTVSSSRVLPLLLLPSSSCSLAEVRETTLVAAFDRSVGAFELILCATNWDGGFDVLCLPPAQNWARCWDTVCCLSAQRRVRLKLSLRLQKGLRCCSCTHANCSSVLWAQPVSREAGSAHHGRTCPLVACSGCFQGHFLVIIDNRKVENGAPTCLGCRNLYCSSMPCNTAF